MRGDRALAQDHLPGIDVVVHGVERLDRRRAGVCQQDFRHLLPIPSCKALTDFHIMQIIRHKAAVEPAEVGGHQKRIDSSHEAYIAQTSSVNSTWEYAISGAPIMVNGVAATSTDIQDQGWDLSWTYNTWHGCLAVTTNSSTGADEFYYLAIKTTTNSFITTEVCNTLNNLGLGIQNAIMLDGGGSFIFKYSGTTRAETTENRQINNIMYF